MTSRHVALPLFERRLVMAAGLESLRKLNPRALIRNPVMFVVGVTSVFVTFVWLRDLIAGGYANASVIGQIALWLWFTVVFANFAEALAEGRGKARADSLRRTQTETGAKLLYEEKGRRYRTVAARGLKRGDVVLVEAGDVIPNDGEVIEGIASVNESAITGESAPVIRESGGDRSGVTGGTRVVSDWIKVQITAGPGEAFLDRMIALVEGADRQKTPNEIALHILLVGLTIVFLLVVFGLEFFAFFSGATISVVFLAALLITLIPTTIGGLLSAIGIAGMDRLCRRMSSPSLVARLKPLGMWTRCSSTRQARLRSEIEWRVSFCRQKALQNWNWRALQCSPRSVTTRRKASPSWLWPRSAIDSRLFARQARP